MRFITRKNSGPAAWRAAGAIAGLILVLTGMPAAQADELSGRRLVFGGFGTLAADYNFSHGLEYRSNAGEAGDADPHRLQLGTDSVAGLQMNAALNHQLETVLQIVSRDNAEHRWRPRLTRGFVRYVPDEAIMLRAGRIGYEFFPHADSSDIGYAFLTMRPPVEIFGQLPQLDFDGADVTLTHPIGPGLGRLKLFGGKTSGTLLQNNGTRADLSGSTIWGTQAQYLWGPWTAQLGAGWFVVAHPPSLQSLSDALDQTGQAQAQQLANQFETAHNRSTILSAALTYDNGPWQMRLYLTRIETANITGPTEDIGNVTLGYGIGKVTPFVLLSRARNYSHLQPTGLPDSPQTADLNSAAELAQTLTQTNQSTAAAGLRYDFAPKMDLKFQIDRVWEQGSEFVLERSPPPHGNGDLTVFGLALDFVF